MSDKGSKKSDKKRNVSLDKWLQQKPKESKTSAAPRANEEREFDFIPSFYRNKFKYIREIPRFIIIKIVL